MKITLDMMDSADVRYSWETVYTALSYDFAEVSEAEKYALKVMEADDYEDNEFITDLAWGGKGKEEITSGLLEEKLVTNVKSFEEIELEKIKYTMLFYLKYQNEDSNDRLLKAIEEVYADFGYPEEMSSFIYYMPVNNKLGAAKGGMDLISEFNIYLKQLKDDIGRFEV